MEGVEWDLRFSNKLEKVPLHRLRPIREKVLGPRAKKGVARYHHYLGCLGGSDEKVQIRRVGRVGHRGCYTTVHDTILEPFLRSEKEIDFLGS